jgi:hypothetical protein
MIEGDSKIGYKCIIYTDGSRELSNGDIWGKLSIYIGEKCI